MSDEIVEENPTNPVEEAPVEQPQMEMETPVEKPKEEFSEREKRYYARMKVAEAEAKTARAEAAKAKVPISDVDIILEVQNATAGLSPQEVEELQARAKIKGSSLSEARKDENFILWQDALKAKVEKEKQTLAPSNKQSEVEKPKGLGDELVEAHGKSLDDLGDALMKRNLYKPPHRRHERKQIGA